MSMRYGLSNYPSQTLYLFSIMIIIQLFQINFQIDLQVYLQVYLQI